MTGHAVLGCEGEVFTDALVHTDQARTLLITIMLILETMKRNSSLSILLFYARLNEVSEALNACSPKSMEPTLTKQRARAEVRKRKAQGLGKGNPTTPLTSPDPRPRARWLALWASRPPARARSASGLPPAAASASFVQLPSHSRSVEVVEIVACRSARLTSCALLLLARL